MIDSGSSGQEKIFKTHRILNKIILIKNKLNVTEKKVLFKKRPKKRVGKEEFCEII